MAAILGETQFVGTNNADMEESGILEKITSSGSCYLALNQVWSRPGRHVRGGILSRLNQFRAAKRLKLDPTLARRPLALGALVFGTIELANLDILWYFRDHQALKAVPEAGSGARPLGSGY
jgi:hypothetical protein